jgi:hypothetical protein
MECELITDQDSREMFRDRMLMLVWNLQRLGVDMAMERLLSTDDVFGSEAESG